MTEPRIFTMTPGDGGKYAVTIDGTDVSGCVSAVGIDAATQQVPVVTLTTVRPISVELAAHVQQQPDPRLVEDVDETPEILRFLAAIDAEALEQAALNRADLAAGPHELTRAMLRQLGEWAAGV